MSKDGIGFSAKPTAYSIPRDSMCALLPTRNLISVRWLMDDPCVAEVLFTAFDHHHMRPANIHLMMTAKGYRPVATNIYLCDHSHVANETVSAFKDDLLIDFTPRENDP